MSGTREEERRKLADIINHWNANRLDLFEISQPTEVSPWTFRDLQAATGYARNPGGKGTGKRRPTLVLEYSD